MPRERATGSSVTPEDHENPGHERGASTLSPHMTPLQDQDAVALLRRGDERGFDLAYERHAERLFGFLVRLSRSRALAEDLLQHTFLRLAESGQRLRPDSDLRAWLFAVARNAFQSHVRALRVEARRAPSSAGPSLALASDASGPEASLAVQELERALGQLSVEDRELLLLIGVECLSYGEMEKVLGIDVVTIRKRVSRARSRLAQILDERPGVVRNSEVKP